MHELQKAESGEMELSKTQEPAPAKELAPQDSIRNDKVICLECGAEMRQLTQKHLVFHGMDQKEYKKKHGFPMKTRLAAESLVEAQIKAGKKEGLAQGTAKVHGGEKAGESRSGRAGAHRDGGSRQTEEDQTPEEEGGVNSGQKSMSLRFQKSGFLGA